MQTYVFESGRQVVAGYSPSLRQKCCPLPPDLSVCDVVCFWFPALYTLLPSLENLGNHAGLSKLESTHFVEMVCLKLCASA